jgi:hypothetical protein
VNVKSMALKGKVAFAMPLWVSSQSLSLRTCRLVPLSNSNHHRFPEPWKKLSAETVTVTQRKCTTYPRPAGKARMEDASGPREIDHLIHRIDNA